MKILTPTSPTGKWIKRISIALFILAFASSLAFNAAQYQAAQKTGKPVTKQITGATTQIAADYSNGPTVPVNAQDLMELYGKCEAYATAVIMERQKQPLIAVISLLFGSLITIIAWGIRTRMDGSVNTHSIFKSSNDPQGAIGFKYSKKQF